MSVEELLEHVSRRIHREAHIRLKPELCAQCPHMACVCCCPAGCYQWNELRGSMQLVYESCLECGTCMIVCDQGAVEWEYPRGGYGVRFRLT